MCICIYIIAPFAVTCERHPCDKRNMDDDTTTNDNDDDNDDNSNTNGKQ